MAPLEQGVFEFDKRGHAFLDTWHEKTVRIFGLPMWRTRDQGTFVATAWEFGLQNARTIPKRFNTIIDPNIAATMVSRAGDVLTTDAFLSTVCPVFSHVMGRFGDDTWDVWRWVHARAKVDFSRPSDDTSSPK